MKMSKDTKAVLVLCIPAIIFYNY